MSYFTQNFLDFFSELSPNTSIQWFGEKGKSQKISVKKSYWSEIGTAVVLSQNVVDVVLEHFDASRTMLAFLRKAVS